MSPLIQSAQNETFKKIKSLTKAKGIKEHQLILISGKKIIQEYLSRLQQDNNEFLRKNSFWLMTKNHTPSFAFESEPLYFSQALFKELDTLGTNSPMICSPCPRLQEISNLETSKDTLYCALGDPTNLGATLRSCCAFGMEQVVLLKEACHPFLPKALKSASGVSLNMKIFSGPSIWDLKNPNLFGLDGQGTLEVGKVDLPSPFHFVVGEEGPGLPENFVGQTLKIPMKPSVESLNGAVATSILLYHWQLKNSLS